MFHFDVHDDIRLVHDTRVEKDESHPGKVRAGLARSELSSPSNRWLAGRVCSRGLFRSRIEDNCYLWRFSYVSPELECLTTKLFFVCPPSVVRVTCLLWQIVERRWYERNKHIFPASRWETVRSSAVPRNIAVLVVLAGCPGAGLYFGLVKASETMSGGLVSGVI